MPSRDIIAFLSDGDVLLESGMLPVLLEPDSQRNVLDRVCADRFTGPVHRVGSEVFVHTVAGRTPSRPPGEWIAVSGLTAEQATPDELGPAVRSAVVTAARQHFGWAPAPPRRPEWYSPGWLDTVDEWIDAALHSVGRRRTGNSIVTRMWSLSAIVRVATDSGTVYFKATGGGFDAEPAVTALLAKRHGELIPTVLATAGSGAAGSDDADPRGRGRVWMLLEELSGVQPDQEPGVALALAPTLADLQARSVDDLVELRAVGCPDRAAPSVLDGLAMLLHDSLELARLTAEEQALARAAAPRMAELVHELWACGLPDTLTHGDLHVGNVAYDGSRVRIFDWTDAAVGHPFLDAVLLARSAVEQPADPGDGFRLDRDVIDAYLARWRRHRPHADVARAMELAVPVTELYQAISYEGISRAQEDASRWELEGVVERFLRRLPELVDGVG
ncbi:phosphotransferase family protein [Lysobacter korlensis]|uniref:Phosphotransferase family protein n=1 Tax=Lysobacter korlensis TaxID=553636 RepID=A0ABV6RY53_9GAMM